MHKKLSKEGLVATLNNGGVTESGRKLVQPGLARYLLGKNPISKACNTLNDGVAARTLLKKSSQFLAQGVAQLEAIKQIANPKTAFDEMDKVSESLRIALSLCEDARVVGPSMAKNIDRQNLRVSKAMDDYKAVYSSLAQAICGSVSEE
ncbi:MAG: hypothetical protein NTX79_06065 [Candidatus Micrarchaeota archaeon]|nr:hypothetical protein [Candidatus Micrarchaeota archaeon]